MLCGLLTGSTKIYLSGTAQRPSAVRTGAYGNEPQLKKRPQPRRRGFWGRCRGMRGSAATANPRTGNIALRSSNFLVHVLLGAPARALIPCYRPVRVWPPGTGVFFTARLPARPILRIALHNSRAPFLVKENPVRCPVGRGFRWASLNLCAHYADSTLDASLQSWRPRRKAGPVWQPPSRRGFSLAIRLSNFPQTFCPGCPSLRT
jgi:hypothetical protein